MTGDPLRHITPGEPFKPNAATQNAILDVVRGVRAERNLFRPGQLLAVPDVNWVIGVLTSAMTAATPDGLTGASTFTFKIWRPDPSDSSFPQQFIQDTDDTTGVNRSQRTANAGDVCFFFYLNGEWNADPLDCDS